MILEKQERVLLKAIKGRLSKDLDMVEHLLKAAAAPRVPDSAVRIQKILAAVKSRGGRVSRAELASIASTAGLIINAVGALYQAGYVAPDAKDEKFVVLGPRARLKPKA